MSNSLQTAEIIVKELSKRGYDYSSKTAEIAELFENYLWHGNWECSTSFEDNTPDLNFIQEDEFDQHRDNEGESYTIFSQSHYVQIDGIDYNKVEVDQTHGFKK